VALALKEFQAVVEGADAGLDQDPGHGVLLFLKGQALLGLGRPKEAVDALDQALGEKLDPNFELGRDDARACRRALEDSHAKAEKWQAALEQVSELTRLDPKDAGHWCRKAYYEDQLQRWNDARESSETGIRLDPDFAVIHVFLGAALRKLGKPDEALVEFRKALAIPKTGKCLSPEEEKFAEESVRQLSR
jgi:tetratricopeptide (TPR) repeat protein